MGDYSSVFTIFALMCEAGCAWRWMKSLLFAPSIDN